MLLATALVALAGAPASLADSSHSSNWAGYAVHRSGVHFERVLGSWRQPHATCTPGKPTYSSAWIGLGGYNRSSRALEQIGSDVDCSAAGRIASSAWYELVPAASRPIRVKVRPGDRLTAAVTVDGHRVQLELQDLTSHGRFSKVLHASAIDVSSAEWILEAPSVCVSNSSCQTLPLADFGVAWFSHARALSTAEHWGGISDRHWGVSEITLTSGGRHFIGQGAAGAFAFASPSALSGNGSAFTVTYGSSGVVTSSTSAPSAAVSGGRRRPARDRRVDVL